MKRTLTLLASTTLLAGHAANQQKPNIILFLVDDMGWQDTSVPFWTDSTDLNRVYRTPNMERLAYQGVKFTHAYACPVSSPSRVSLVTGANAACHKVTNWTLKKNEPTDRTSKVVDFETWNYNGLSPVQGVEHAFYAKCLPAVLREHGYSTLFVGKGHFGAIDTPAAEPLNIGFDYNVGGHAAGAMGSYLGEDGYGANRDSASATIWAVPNLEKYHGTHTFLTEALTMEAMELMNKAVEKQKPFFLYMSHYAVHVPLATDDRFVQKYLDRGMSKNEAQYAGLVEGMDKSLGDLMNYVSTKGIADNTIIIFMSDNGGYTVDRPNKNFPLNEGKGSLKEGGIREPMIVSWPGITKNASVNATPVIIEDFFPTILDLAGVNKYSVPQRVDGHSFVPQIKGKQGCKDRTLFFHYPNNWGERISTIGCPQSAIIKGNWKLIHYYETDESCLFNLKEDISEKNNLINQPKYKKVGQALSNELTRYLKDKKATMPIWKESKGFVPYPNGEKVNCNTQKNRRD
jgi:arylsulfatase A-like enzyme